MGEFLPSRGQIKATTDIFSRIAAGIDASKGSPYSGASIQGGIERMGRRSNIENNNFDALRLAGAVGVVLSHCFPACILQDPLYNFLGHSTLGAICVEIFFLMSGFLVTRSAEIHPLLSYARSRTLRIVPGLFVVSLFCALVIGPAFTSLPLSDYFTNPITIRHLFNADIFYLTTSLPGVSFFPGGFFPDLINGSLWTIPYEATMYVLMGLLMALKLVRSWVIVGLTLIFSLSFVACELLTNLTPFKAGPALILDTIHLYSFIKFAMYFFVGSSIYLLRERISYSHAGAAIAFTCIILSAYLPHGQIIMVPSLTYLTFYGAFGIGNGIKLSKSGFGDISYGIYLYGFPVQLVLVKMNPGITP